MEKAPGYQVNHIRGATFYLDIRIPLDLTGATVTSQVRAATTAHLLTTLTPVVTDAESGRFTLSGPSDSWPSGTDVDWDVKITEASGRVVYSERQTFRVVEPVTL